MASYRRLLNVFLASPGDLADERRAAKEVVEELALTARELGVSLELLGWEDTLPGAQRPQDVINKDLDEADLFVGVLWRRWGQPTGNPSFSSGFEEEFNRARARHAQSGVPEMWLFFKEVEAAQLQDPGEQLQKVLLFKARCESEKQFFFKDFKTTEDWTKLLRTHLSRHLARQNRYATTEPAGEGLHSSRVMKVKPQRSETTTSTAPSLLPLVDVLADLANGGNPEPHATKDGGIYSARLYLIGLSLLAESQTSSGLANTHEINTLFRHRKAFEPLPIEQALLERTVLADQAGVKPGWYWFPQEGASQLDTVAVYAFSDGDFDVRRGAFTLLTKGHVRHDDWSSVLFNVETAESQPIEIQTSFWAYLEAIVAASDRNLLEAMRASSAHIERVSNLLLIARSATEPESVLAEAATAPQPPSDRLFLELVTNIHKIDPAVLTAAFSSRHETIRTAIAIDLDRRHLLDEIRAAAQVDTSETIRVLEYRDRLRSAALSGSVPPVLPEGLSYHTDRALAVERLRGLAYEQLQQRIDWFNIESTAAYEVLATDHWESVADQVRADVADNFERIRQQTIDRFAQSVIEQIGFQGQEAANKIAKAAVENQIPDKIDGFMRRQFGAAALAGMERHGSAEDAAFVRRFLNSSLEQNVAIRALARVGDDTDVPALIRIAEESYGDTKFLAAREALLLSGNSQDVIRTLSQTRDSNLVRLALEKLEELGEDSLRSTAVELINNTDASIREVAAEFIIKLLNPEELEEVLKVYVSQATYYYNVVVAMDRSLYCRIPIA